MGQNGVVVAQRTGDVRRFIENLFIRSEEDALTAILILHHRFDEFHRAGTIQLMKGEKMIVEREVLLFGSGRTQTYAVHRSQTEHSVLSQWTGRTKERRKNGDDRRLTRGREERGMIVEITGRNETNDLHGRGIVKVMVLFEMFEQRDLRVRSTNAGNVPNLMALVDAVVIGRQRAVVAFVRFQFSNLERMM